MNEDPGELFHSALDIDSIVHGRIVIHPALPSATEAQPPLGLKGVTEQTSVQQGEPVELESIHGLCGLGQCGSNARDQFGIRSFIGVQVEHPRRIGAQVEGMHLLLGEIRPVSMDDLGPVFPTELDRSVGGSGVHHHDAFDQTVNRVQ